MKLLPINCPQLNGKRKNSDTNEKKKNDKRFESFVVAFNSNLLVETISISRETWSFDAIYMPIFFRSGCVSSIELHASILTMPVRIVDGVLMRPMCPYKTHINNH